jgi:hypothetical protein
MEDSKVWLAFGIVHTLGILEHMPLPASLAMSLTEEVSHLCTTCQDVTVSSLHSAGKKTALEVWKSLPGITEVFQRLSATSNEVTETDLKEISKDMWFCCTLVCYNSLMKMKPGVSLLL